MLSDSRCKAARELFMVQNFLQEPASQQQGCSGKPAQGSPGERGGAVLVSLPCTQSCCEILPWGTVAFGCRLSTSRRAVAVGWVMLSREVALGGREALAVRCRGPGSVPAGLGAPAGLPWVLCHSSETARKCCSGFPPPPPRFSAWGSRGRPRAGSVWPRRVRDSGDNAQEVTAPHCKEGHSRIYKARA